MRGLFRTACAATMVVSLGLCAGAELSAQYAGWKIPEDGEHERSPLRASGDAVSRGRTLYAANCSGCHGLSGKGDGPSSNHAADLADPYRVELNPEGVLFYKIWYGHAVSLREAKFDMPSFEGKLSRDEVWTVVEFVKTLRAPMGR